VKVIPHQAHTPLLARRIPLSAVQVGCAYVIHARNGGVGVAVSEGGRVGYRLHRNKFDRHFLFVEWDWEVDAQFGTAIPLAPIEAVPPEDDATLLAWLLDREVEHADAIQDAWQVVLGATESGNHERGLP
jgi:hypothetical protein